MIPPDWPDRAIPRLEPLVRQDVVNRQLTDQPEHYPMNVTFARGLDFIRRNHGADRWMLQLETFNPHEPFHSLPEYRRPFAPHFERYRGKPVEWPPYREVREPPEVVEHARHEYAALVAGCDAKLGEVLDLFDELNLWPDTMLIVWTDHGFLLGEHDAWAKCWMPFYEEVARTPFFIHDPRHPGAAGARRAALVQPSIDLAPTLLRFFGLEPTPDMLGHDLAGVVADDTPVREHALFGQFGREVNITDGRHVYMRGPATPENQPLAEYTLMPTRMTGRFAPRELQGDVTLSPPLPFTKHCPVLRVPVPTADPPLVRGATNLGTRLFDLSRDPGQKAPLDDPATSARLSQAMAAEMRRCAAPPEQFVRLGL